MAHKMMDWFWLLASCGYVYFARSLSFGSAAAPKAGFVPMIAGIAAVILSLANVINQSAVQQEKGEYFFWRRFLFLVIGLLSYLLFLYSLGSVTATMVMMFYLLKIGGTPGWIKPILLSILCALGFYAVFELLLGTHLP